LDGFDCHIKGHADFIAAPGQERGDVAAVRRAGIVVADVGVEEFDEAALG
jgi:hypothetical protein